MDSAHGHFVTRMGSGCEDCSGSACLDLVLTLLCASLLLVVQVRGAPVWASRRA